MIKLSVLKYKWIYIFIQVLYYISIVDGSDGNKKKIICYLDKNSLESKNNVKFDLNSIDLDLCTHLIYSFVTIKDDDLFPSNEIFGGNHSFNNLKLKNPELKTIVLFKEIENESSELSSVLKSSRKRRNFIQNILKFIKRFNFDGIDIVWQNLGSTYSQKCDKRNYLKFIKEIRRMFTQDAGKLKYNPFSISLGIPYDINEANQNYDIANLNQYVDWFNLMSYDSKELFLNEKANTKYNNIINYYLNAGISRENIILGLSTYGLLFTTDPFVIRNYKDTNFLEDTYKIFELNENVEYLSYSQICKTIRNNPEWKLFKQVFGTLTRIFAVNENQVIVFKDVTVIREAVENVVELALGGISFYTIDQDDFNGSCVEQPYPLIDTAKKVLLQDISLRNSRQTTPLSNELVQNATEIANKRKISKDRVVCYTTSWSVYRTGPAKFDQSRIDPNLCTHLIYAYGTVSNETIQFADEYSDINLGGYDNFIKLRSANPNLKLLIGLRVVDKQFSGVINMPEKRTTFIQNVLQHLQQYGFDGLDIVWRYPGTEDKENFVQLLSEMKTKFIEDSVIRNRSEPYIISIIIPSEIQFIDAGYDLIKLNDLVDWYNLLSYDYHLAKESIVNHHSPLYEINEMTPDSMNVNSSVNYYLNAGIERTQLVVGIPTYGISFTLKDSNNNNFGAAADGPGLPGKFTNITGAMAYYEICEAQLSSANWQIYRPFPGRVGPYAVNENQWVAYDDEIMVKNKAEYVADMGLGGVMFWTIDQDDFRGICNSRPNILIQTAKEALLTKLNLGSLILISTTPIQQLPSREMNFVMVLESGTEPAPIALTNNSIVIAPVSMDRTNVNVNNRIVCYTTSWSVYRTGAGRFTQNLFDPNLCTHIIYAYGNINENNTFTSYDPNSDFNLNGFSQLNDLKKLNPYLRNLIGIRDFSEDASIFPAIVASKERRQLLIQSIVDFLTENNFDGIDIVWKHPKVNERDVFVEFVKEIADKFSEESILRSREPFLLLIALPGKKVEMQGYDIARLNEYVDWFNVLSYNYHSATEPEANHAAALYPFPEFPSGELNVNFTATQYLNSGADRSKLVITIPTYGRTFTLANSSQMGYASPAIAPGNGGEITKLAGSLAYYEICNLLLQDSGWNSYQPYPKLVGPYIVKDNQWVSFDDENMMRTKADYVAENGFGGLAFWSIDQDDFRGNCGGNPFALINTAKNRLFEKLSTQDGALPTINSANSMIPGRITTPAVITPTTSIIPTSTSTSTTTSTSTSPPTTTPTSSTAIFAAPNAGNSVPEENTNNRIVCYATNWSFYRSGVARFVPSERNLNPNLCSHLIYFFAKIENDTVLPLDDNVDIANNGYNLFTGLKNKNPNLKTLISISELQSNESLSKFSQIAANETRRRLFIENVLNFIKEYNFDGIDLVWMHPGDLKGTPNDKINLVKLIEELRTAFDTDILLAGHAPYIITLAVPFDTEIINKGYDISNLNNYLDWFNLLTYDYHLSTEPVVNHHSPLFPYQGSISAENNINFTVTKYMELGAERNKIVIGTPTYGRSFTLADPLRTDYGSPAAGPGMKGPLTQLNESLAYYEICQNINNNGWNVVQNQSDLVGPYAFQNRNWVAYDDEIMVGVKAEYVALMGLGGMMFWTVDQDDFLGACTGQANLLISTAKEMLNQKLNIGIIKANTIDGTNNIIKVESTTSSISTDINILTRPMTDVIENNHNIETNRNRIVCYSPNWSIYRKQFAKFDSSLILPDICTHLIYAFAYLENDTVVSSDPFADITQMGYENFNNLKLKNPQLLTLISIRQKENSTKFTDLVSNVQRRQIFADNIFNFTQSNGFDGVDIDWQYPGENPSDKSNFIQLLSEINSRFRQNSDRRFLLTITVPSDKMNLDRGYNIVELNALVDWYNLLSYNYHMPTELFVNHLAPLYALQGYDNTESNVNATVNHYLNAKIQRDKLVVGIPTFGISFILADESSTVINSPAVGPNMKGELSGNEGALAFYEICQQTLNDPAWNIVQVEPRVMGPYAFKGNRWIAYDDEAMVRRKANYVADNGLGGLMFWSIDQDDFRGICYRKQNVLIQAGKEALLAKLSVTAPSTSKDILFNSSILSDNRVPSSESISAGSLTLNNGFKCQDFGLFANPTDCKSFYACVDLTNGEMVNQLVSCPNGTYFDPVRLNCTAMEGNEDCRQQNIDLIKSSTTTTTTTTTTTINIPPVTFPSVIQSTANSLTSVAPPVIQNTENSVKIPPSIEQSTVPSVKDSNTINQITELLKYPGAIEKFEEFLKTFQTSTTPIPDSPIITADNIKKLSLSTQINVAGNTGELIMSNFGLPKGNGHGNKHVSSNDYIYQIKELHIHNYGESILDERSLSSALQRTNVNNFKKQLTKTEDQPLIVLAPVQVINKVYS